MLVLGGIGNHSSTSVLDIYAACKDQEQGLNKE